MNDTISPEGESQEQLEDVSPSLKGGMKKPKEPKPKEKAADKAKDLGKEVGDKAVKKGAREMTKQAALAAGRAIASAFASIAGAIGWPYMAGCLVIVLIVLLIFGGLGCQAINGYFGKTLVNEAGKDDPNVKALLAASDQPAGVFSKNKKLEFAYDRDKEFVASGKIDKRLAAALNYLVQKHEHIRISHIVSAYEDMKANPESGSFHDIQISKNISAHQNGGAADIDQIDFVKEKCDCGSQIPVKLAWQTIGENPYGEVPDALDKIKGPGDFTNPDVQKALEELGVTGLEQPDLNEKIQAIAVLRNISSPYDLTDPAVIAAFDSIGVGGIGNENLQKGLKRIKALQSLYELNIGDISALRNSQVQSLFNEVGVPISEETIQNIEKFQAVSVLQSITSLEDLQKPDVKDALQKLGLNADDLNLQSALGKFGAASTIVQWDGTQNEAINKAMTELGLGLDANTQKALNIYNGAKNLFTGINGGITSEAQLIYTLEQLSVDIGNPEAQEAVNKFKAAYAIVKDPANFSDPEYLQALNEFGIGLSDQDKAVIDKYKAAQVINEAINGEWSADSPEVKNALTTLGASSLSDQIAQYAVILSDLKNMENLDQGQIQQIVGGLKIDLPESQITLEKIVDAQRLLSIRNISDLQRADVQMSLQNIGIDNQKIYKTIGQLGSLQTVLEIRGLKDLQRADVQKALSNLNINNEKVTEAMGKIGDIYTLFDIRSPADLARPEVIQMLSESDAINAETTGQLADAGAVYSLAQIREPADLLKPENLKALDQLGLIEVNEQFLGQIGAVQNLMQVRSIGDLMNPSSILALNTLGIISLSNPITTGLMVLSFADNIFGGNLLGGMFGGKCKTNTDCYKPTAQTNVHKAIGELLQFPYDQGNPDNYRITQLIIYSAERDVTPFSDKLDKLYGKDRPANYGLFSMPEASTHIHIGY